MDAWIVSIFILLLHLFGNDCAHAETAAISSQDIQKQCTYTVDMAFFVDEKCRLVSEEWSCKGKPVAYRDYPDPPKSDKMVLHVSTGSLTVSQCMDLNYTVIYADVATSEVMEERREFSTADCSHAETAAISSQDILKQCTCTVDMAFLDEKKFRLVSEEWYHKGKPVAYKEYPPPPKYDKMVLHVSTGSLTVSQCMDLNYTVIYAEVASGKVMEERREFSTAECHPVNVPKEPQDWEKLLKILGPILLGVIGIGFIGAAVCWKKCRTDESPVPGDPENAHVPLADLDHRRPEEVCRLDQNQQEDQSPV
ncbi:hypothetical protein GJAV_G00220730 [Gymnothorax javanicus]|nr:hypothetical protein GJAV_G00220730 [Gymnothorax javanicus]